MSLLDGQTPIVVDDFKGLYIRSDNVQTPVPPGYQAQCANSTFIDNSVQTRTPFVRNTSVDGVTNLLYYTEVTLDNGVVLRLALDSIKEFRVNGVVVGTFPTARRILAVSAGNRAIVLIDGNLFTTNGVEFRPCFGAAPTAGSPLVVTQPAPGSVAAGFRRVAVVYETSTGFLTNPGPLIAGTFTPTSLTTTGTNNLQVSNIPIGPASTIARHIVITRANGEEYFFVPGGRIPDNASTITTLDFLDTDLVASADYLFDVLPSLSSVSHIARYKNRFVYAAGFGLYISAPLEFENVDRIDSFKKFTSLGPLFVTALFEHRDILYMCTDSMTFSTQETGDVPSSWVLTITDQALGATYDGVARVIASGAPGVESQRQLVVNRSGLYLFDGIFAPQPLSYNVEFQWRSLQWASFDFRVVVDPRRKQIYVGVATLDSAATSSLAYLMVCDYSRGLSPDTVRWSNWSFGNWLTIDTVFLAIGEPPFVPRLHIGSRRARYGVGLSETFVQSAADADTGDPFNGYYRMQLAFHFENSGQLLQFLGFRVEARCVGPAYFTAQVNNPSAGLVPFAALYDSDVSYGKFVTRIGSLLGERFQFYLISQQPVPGQIYFSTIHIFAMHFYVRPRIQFKPE